MSDFREVFTDEVLEECQKTLDDLSIAMIESCAQVAYNDVIFESALLEADEEGGKEEEKSESKKSSGAKTALYKALETLKRVAATIFAKIRAAINTLIAKASTKGAAAWVKRLSNEKNVDWKSVKIVPKKDFMDINDLNSVFNLNPEQIVMWKSGSAPDSEEEIAKIAKNRINIPANYPKAREAFDNAKTVSEVNKIVVHFASYVNENKTEYTVTEWMDRQFANPKAVAEDLKSNYNQGLGKINGAIKDCKNRISSATTGEQENEIKKNITILNKLLSNYHACYIGRINYVIAANACLVDAIKQAKKVSAKSESFEFMGLSLL